MITNRKPRRGRPPKFVRDPETGAEIHGLSAQPIRKNGEIVKHRYYATYSDPREWLGYDFNEGVRRFYAWRSRQKGKTVSISYEKDVTPENAAKGAQILRCFPALRESADQLEQTLRRSITDELPEDAVFSLLADVIRTTDPKVLARKTGIRELAWLWQQKAPGESMALNNDGEFHADSEEMYLARPYFEDKQDAITGKEWRNSITWWNEFCAITGAQKVSDLDRAAFLKYRQQINRDQKRLRRSNSYTRSRFGKIKSIINYAVGESALVLSERDQQTLTDRAALKMPPKPRPKPLTISPDELNDILKAADDWDEALILTALNCAYLNVDCRRLRWDMIDWEAKTIRFDRQKSEELAEEGELPRLSVLWKRTVKALRKIEHDGEYVFEIDDEGTPACQTERTTRAPHIDTIYDHFIECVKASGVAANRKKSRKRSLAFIHLRKSAISAASNDDTVPDRHVDLLAGHSAGIKEHYVVPNNVIKACQAVERTYFSTRPRKLRAKV